MIEQYMNAMNYGDESDRDLISTEMLEDICDGSQTHPTVNKREARYKIRDHIMQKKKTEWKKALKATRSMGKGLHKVFLTALKEISEELTLLGESGSEVYHFIPEPRNFAEVTKFSENMKKPWIK